ncbi:hypothetical protein B2J96_20275 [Mycobacterium shigaense]|nr:hypothetical protein B2J96_20275 [Mycobacterium shigaense]
MVRGERVLPQLVHTLARIAEFLGDLRGGHQFGEFRSLCAAPVLLLERFPTRWGRAARLQDWQAEFV